jgi:hypothetical protein
MTATGADITGHDNIVIVASANDWHGMARVAVATRLLGSS